MCLNGERPVQPLAIGHDPWACLAQEWEWNSQRMFTKCTSDFTNMMFWIHCSLTIVFDLECFFTTKELFESIMHGNYYTYLYATNYDQWHYYMILEKWGLSFFYSWFGTMKGTMYCKIHFNNVVKKLVVTKVLYAMCKLVREYIHHPNDDIQTKICLNLYFNLYFKVSLSTSKS